MISIIQQRRYWFILSGGLVAVSVIVFMAWGLRLGIDFTGGSLLELRFNEGAFTHSVIQDVFKNKKIDVTIQDTDGGALLRFGDVSEAVHQELLARLDEAKLIPDSSLEEVRFESIGPSIGSELVQKSVRAIIVVLIAIVLYIAWAFRKVSRPIASWKYGMVALVVLFHDVLIVIGLFVVLGKFYNVEVGAPFIAALLTVLGYSVNDTIVVFDRVRENIHSSGISYDEVVEKSVRQSFTRSVNTSFTTLLTLFAIFLFGGVSIQSFVLALIVGIFVGTYSSLFLASPLLVVWHRLSNG